MRDETTLTLTETGVARLDDGSEAVNVGPIVAALGFLTEGRGDDRGVDEHGAPLPDLLSLAFEVVKSIILGGRYADYFRRVKLDFDAAGDASATSISLAKHAERLTTPRAALLRKSQELRGRLQKLEQAAAELLLEIEAEPGPSKKARAPRRKKARVRSSDERRASGAKKAAPKRKFPVKPKSRSPKKVRAR